MDVQIDGDVIRLEREKRAWSQEHLAGAAGIGVRTIQRIEATGVASYESVRAISAALEIPVGKLGAARALPRLPAVRWLGVGLAVAILTGTSGFLLLKDYQKVRVLRTLEHWVTSEAGSALASSSGLAGIRKE
jgi:transcriptional regulator with XRE-family HTH domain